VEVLEDRTLLSAAPVLLPALFEPAGGPGAALARAVKISSVPVELAGKVQEQLWDVAEQVRLTRASAPLASVAVDSRWVQVSPAGTIQTHIHVAGPLSAVSRGLAGLGISVEASNDGMAVIQAWVPADALPAVAHLAGVRFLDLPSYARPRTGSVNSAGDGIHLADAVRSRFAGFGVDGSGVRVGVISTGIPNRARVTGNPNFDLPATITIDPDRPGVSNDDEGTAMLEIIHDLAPGASLYFSGPRTNLDMVNAINWMVSQGVQVLVDDLGFSNEPFFADGPVAQAAADAVARGVTFVTAAGNEAPDHYQASFRGAGSTGQAEPHDFGAGDVGQSVLIPPGGAFEAVLQWSDPFGGSRNDYDLILVRSSDGALLAFSSNLQTGSQNPFERLLYVNPTGSTLTAFVAILNFGGAPRELELFTTGDDSQQYTTPADSIVGHAAVLSVITVAAIDADDPGQDQVDPDISAGPSTIYTNFTSQTKVLRDSLDGAGIQGVQTRIGQLGFFPNPFFGSSAAAPHVAAIVALLKDADPSLTPAQIATALTTTAVDLTVHGTGYDSVSGFGRFNALDAVYDVFTPAAPDLTAAGDSGLSSTDNLTRHTALTFTGTVPLGSFVRLYVDGVEAATQQLGATESAYSLTAPALTPGVHQITVRVGASAATPTSRLSNASAALAVTVDTTPPTADIVDVSPDPRITGVDAITVAFNEVVAGFDAADLALRRDGSANLLTAAQTLTSGDNRTWTLGNLAGLTSPLGAYSLTLTAAGSGITDVAGNPLTVDAADSWARTLAAPGVLQFSAVSYSISESGVNAAITVNRIDGSGGTVTVAYATSNGTATAGTDYTAAAGTLTFTDGELTKVFTVIVHDDALVEGNETINLTLSAPTGGAALGTPSTAVLTILDNDVLIVPTRFDFGTAASPVASGYAQVTEDMTFSAARGFGWQSGAISSRDRGTGNALTRDLHLTRQGTFAVILANGTYTVTVTMGDASVPHDRMGVSLEGVQVDEVNTAAREFVTRSYPVTISDGQLTLALRDLGGSDSNAVINALEITVSGPGGFLPPPEESDFAVVAVALDLSERGGMPEEDRQAPAEARAQTTNVSREWLVEPRPAAGLRPLLVERVFAARRPSLDPFDPTGDVLDDVFADGWE
jgi:hypothetical protein